VLLAKTLTSSTFRLALIAIGTFGVIVSAIFSYVYLSTSSYVRSRSDRAIVTEYLSLKSAYERSGRDGLIALIQERIADSSFADNVYILADPSLVTLAGNLKVWPSTATAARRMDRVSRGRAVAQCDKPGRCCGRCSKHFRAAIVCWWEGISASSTASLTRSRRP
jgi:hypothetical protein